MKSNPGDVKSQLQFSSFFQGCARVPQWPRVQLRAGAESQSTGFKSRVSASHVWGAFWEIRHGVCARDSVRLLSPVVQATCPRPSGLRGCAGTRGILPLLDL